MFFKGKEHTFVIYDGKVTPPEWLFRRIKVTAAWAITLAAPAAQLSKYNLGAEAQPARLVLSDGTEKPLANATINGSTVELTAL